MFFKSFLKTLAITDLVTFSSHHSPITHCWNKAFPTHIVSLEATSYTLCTKADKTSAMYLQAILKSDIIGNKLKNEKKNDTKKLQKWTLCAFCVFDFKNVQVEETQNFFTNICVSANICERAERA